MTFGLRRPHEDPNVGQFTAWQNASDPRTEAPAFVQEIWLDAHLTRIHPLAVSDCQQLRMYFAGTALVNDLAAEALGGTAETDAHGHRVIERAVGWYAVRLSDAAEERMGQAGGIEPEQYVDGYVFTDEVIADLAPDNNLPLWPRSARRADFAEWQFDERDTPEVTVPFLRAVIGAARDLRTQTFGNIEALYGRSVVDGGEFQIDAPVPSQYRSLEHRLDNLQNSSEAQLTAAQHLLDVNNEPAWGAYTNVHSGFVGMVTALLATYCPPVLGREYVLQR